MVRPLSQHQPEKQTESLMDSIENRVFDDIEIGDTAKLSHVLTLRDIQLFAVMSGDVNPAHLDEEYAKSDMFHAIIGHGMWSASLISTVLGTQLPGPGTILLDQSLKFIRPVHVGDTITASVTVKETLAEKHQVILSCLCVNQQGKEIVTGEAHVIAPTEKVKRKRVVLPRIEIKESVSRFYHELVAQKNTYAPLKTAIVHPVDGNALCGALAAAEQGIITPVLVGPEHKIRSIAEAEGVDLSPYEIIGTKHSHEAAARAVEMARSGQVEALMKGKLETSEFMHPALDAVSGLRTGRRMSHVFTIDVPTYPKPLFLTDAALNLEPDLMTKRDIVQNAIDLFTMLRRAIPKVAIVSAVEMVNAKIPSTLDATALCKMAERGQITGGLLDGPLAFDNAISREAAEAKGIISQVAGDADIIVVPDVESGNMLYKQLVFLSGYESAGIVMGARVPLILTSRAADRGMTRIASCAMALLYARRKAELKAEMIEGSAA